MSLFTALNVQYLLFDSNSLPPQLNPFDVDVNLAPTGSEAKRLPCAPVVLPAWGPSFCVRPHCSLPAAPLVWGSSPRAHIM